MRPLHRHTQLFGQIGDAAHMIEMAVGNENFLDRPADLLQSGVNVVEIAARINHGHLAAGFALEKGAVLLVGSNGQDGVFHGGSDRTG